MKILKGIGWILWLVVAWLVASLIASIVIVLIDKTLGYNLLKDQVATAATQVVYLALMLAILVGIPMKLGQNKHLSKTKRWARAAKLLGIQRRPNADDATPLLVGVAIYYLAAFLLTAVASLFLSNQVINQMQDVGFSATNNPWMTLVIVVVLVVATPIAEELVFRGYLYGKLRRLFNPWAAAIVVSLIFAVAHGQINVGITTFVLSMVSCRLREHTGAIWSSIGLHATTNLVASTLLFILPMFA